MEGFLSNWYKILKYAGFFSLGLPLEGLNLTLFLKFREVRILAISEKSDLAMHAEDSIITLCMLKRSCSRDFKDASHVDVRFVYLLKPWAYQYTYNESTFIKS